MMKKNLGAKDLIFPAPVLIVGTYDETEVPNAMNVAWGGLCSSNPPAIAISIRKERKTHDNILRRNAFTVQIATESLMQEADYFGMISGHRVNKLEQASMKATHAEHVDAPCLEAFPLILECEVLHILEIGQHVHIVGKIVNVVADEAILDDKGTVDVTKLKAIGYDPAGNHYVAASQIVGKAFSAGARFLKK